MLWAGVSRPGWVCRNPMRLVELAAMGAESTRFVNMAPPTSARTDQEDSITFHLSSGISREPPGGVSGAVGTVSEDSSSSTRRIRRHPATFGSGRQSAGPTHRVPVQIPLRSAVLGVSMHSLACQMDLSPPGDPHHRWRAMGGGTQVRRTGIRRDRRLGRTGAADERKTTPDDGRRWKVSPQVRGRFQALSRWASPTRDRMSWYSSH